MLLARRLEPPQRGMFALPGGFVGGDEAPEQTAERKLREKTGVGSVHLEQLRTYADPDARPARLAALGRLPGPGAAGDAAGRRPAGARGELAPGRRAAGPRARPRADRRRRAVAAARPGRRQGVVRPRGRRLLAEAFTLAQAQRLYEALRGEEVDAANFRRDVRATGLVAETGARTARVRAGRAASSAGWRHELGLRAGDLAATFEPDAGLVCASFTRAGEELLGQRGGLEAWRAGPQDLRRPAAASVGEPAERLGLDIPRDSRGRQGGRARAPDPRRPARDGQVDGPRRLRDRLQAGARLRPARDWLAAFPFPHRLEIEASLDPGGLRIATALTATGDVPVPVSFGWHPYLQLPGVPCRIGGSPTSVRARLVLDERGIPTGAREDAPVRPGSSPAAAFDHLYADAAGAWFTVRRRRSRSASSRATPTRSSSPTRQGPAGLRADDRAGGRARHGDGLRRVAPGEAFRAEFRIGLV